MSIVSADPKRLILRPLCHVLSGHPIGALEPLSRLQTKLGNLATNFGLPQINALGCQSKTAFIEQTLYLTKSYP